MKRFILILFLAFFTIDSFSQGMYGFEGGFGKTMSYTSHLTPELEGYILTKINRHLYVGGSLGYERFSFLYNSNILPAVVAYGDVINIRHKSSYLFFSPKIDLGIGYRKYLHLNLSFGAGLYMGGSQWTNKYQQIFTLPATTVFRSDTGGSYTSYNAPTLIFRYGIGLSERIPTYGYWNIILSQDFGYMPKSFDKTVPNLVTNYFCFSVGLMHKYHQVLVEY